MVVIMIGMLIYENFNNKIYRPYLISLGIVAFMVLFHKTSLETIQGLFSII